MMKKTAQMRCIEAERGARLEAIIAAGIEAGQSWEEIAFDLGVSRITLREWTRRMGGKVSERRTIRFSGSEREEM